MPPPPPSQGYLSYPRTESSAYPPNSDLTATCALLQRHPLYGEYAQSLLAKGAVNIPAVGGRVCARVHALCACMCGLWIVHMHACMCANARLHASLR